MSREAAAESAGMERQTLRDWVIRYNEHGLDGLCDRGGRAAAAARRRRAGGLAAIVLAGPDPEADGISAFTREDLVASAKNVRQINPSDLDGPPAETARAVAAEGAASHPKQDPAAMAAFKKSPGDPERNSAYA